MGLLDDLFSQRCDLPEAAGPDDLRALPARGGVYTLADSAGRPIITIGAESIRRSVAGRIRAAASPRSRRPDLAAVARTVWWQPTSSAFETSLVYLNIIRRVAGPDHAGLLAFGPVWFAVLDPAARLPRWRLEADPFGPGRQAAGPFATRRAAQRLVEILEDVFDLCRRHDILEQYPHGRPCAYFDMGRCPAPCNASIALERYRDMLADSLNLAVGRAGPWFAALQAAMSSAAASLDFERAAALRERMDRAREAQALERLAPTVEQFRFLVVQRGSPASAVKPFFVDRGIITPGREVRLTELEGAVEAWIRQVTSSDNQGPDSAEYRLEGMRLVCHFLGRGPRAPGLFLPAEALGAPAEVARQVRERCAAHRPKAHNSASQKASDVDVQR